MNAINLITPLELLNLYYSDGQSLGNKENRLWQKMNSLLSWENILNKGYQSDLCPLKVGESKFASLYKESSPDSTKLYSTGSLLMV
jgi:hypothetical protein